jgi:hypothetical protein
VFVRGSLGGGYRSRGDAGVALCCVFGLDHFNQNKSSKSAIAECWKVSWIEDHDDWSDEYLDWCHRLQTEVIEDEFGYEAGEFTVYPAIWFALYSEGLTPRLAWQRALDAHSAARVEDECLRAINWARIQYEDEQAVADYRYEMAPTELDELQR